MLTTAPTAAEVNKSGSCGPALRVAVCAGMTGGARPARAAQTPQGGATGRQRATGGQFNVRSGVGACGVYYVQGCGLVTHEINTRGASKCASCARALTLRSPRGRAPPWVHAGGFGRGRREGAEDTASWGEGGKCICMVGRKRRAHGASACAPRGARPAQCSWRRQTPLDWCGMGRPRARAATRGGRASSGPSEAIWAAAAARGAGKASRRHQAAGGSTVRVG